MERRRRLAAYVHIPPALLANLVERPPANLQIDMCERDWFGEEAARLGLAGMGIRSGPPHITTPLYSAFFPLGGNVPLLALPATSGSMWASTPESARSSRRIEGPSSRGSLGQRLQNMRSRATRGSHARHFHTLSAGRGDAMGQSASSGTSPRRVSTRFERFSELSPSVVSCGRSFPGLREP